MNYAVLEIHYYLYTYWQRIAENSLQLGYFGSRCLRKINSYSKR